MSKSTEKQYIIAIGASAGGLEAISAFFDYTPLDAVSYILIQHLSPDFKSQMAQILARHSKMEVVEVTDQIKIENNKVYLIPSSNFMSIKDGTLILSDKRDKPRPHMTIDHFFLSLAEERGEKAIGVILSGTGHDGSKGVEAIKKAGGFILVQDPATSTYQEMPLSAIATNIVNRVLSPKEMPQVIKDYVLRDNVALPVEMDHEMIEDQQIGRIIKLIKGVLPLDFTDYKRATISRRINRRMAMHNLNHSAEYYQFLIDHPQELSMLANDFLIGVTTFFRDSEAFSIIEKTVIPAIIANKTQDDVLKIWVAGCATGEEAYTMAILVKEYLDKAHQSLEVKIFATDLSQTALYTASLGIYPNSINKTISKERLDLFFTKEGQNFKVKPEIRKMLIFAQHDLTKNPPFCNIDFISCRNLLIYLNLSLQKKVISMLHFGLKKEGYLFLGPSENVMILRLDFKEISHKWNILQCVKIGRPVKFETFSSPVVEGFKTTTMEISKKAIIPTSKIAFAEEINLAVLEESGFSGVCTNENLMVIQSFGHPATYLKNEIFNLNLNDLLPGQVSAVLKAGVHKALKLNQRVSFKGLDFSGEDSPKAHLVNIMIKPFSNKTTENFLLILFSENGHEVVEKNILNDVEIQRLTSEHLINLEDELASVKQKLEIANEQLLSSKENQQSFNEELQSANEEMQSANEEMHSSNEELQSVNEELNNINKEHQVTNAALSELNDDLNNYFRSNLNGQLFVDRDLLLKKYSPGAVKHINIRETDIGRPLSNITTNIKLDSFIDDIQQVMLDDLTIVREAESADGNVYQVMMMPYVRKDSLKSDGAIISFHEITEFKKVLKQLDDSNISLKKSNEEITVVNNKLLDRNAQLLNSKKYTEEIFNTIHDPLVILNKDLKVIRATDGFYEMFKVNEEETEGCFLYDLGNKQWDIPALRHQLEQVLLENGSFNAFEVDHVFISIGRKIMRLSARQFDTNTNEKLTLLAIHDLTDKRKVEEGLAIAERLLADSKERLAFAIEAAGIGTWDFNPMTGELLLDKRCRALFGFGAKAPIDYFIFLRHVHADDRSLINEAINKSLLIQGSGEFNAEFRVIEVNGQKSNWIKSKGKAYFNKEKKAYRFTGTVLDISIEKALEKNTKEQLAQKDEFISIASHELKTPVTSLKASLQLLNRMKDNPSPVMFPRLIEQSSKSVEKIITLIDDLLNVTRMNEGQIALHKAPFVIFKMLNQCCSHVRAAGKHELIIQGDEELIVVADEHRIEQVIVNFVNNAVKYAPNSKDIYINVEQVDAVVKVSVRDNGPGIAQDIMARVFDRYYRANYSGGQYSGLGLGLYISSEIIRRHGGKIGVTSEAGQGSTFWFELPL